MSVLVENDVDIAPRRKNKEEADLDITPMIDVTFLLLAFFVVVSKIDQQPPIALPTANHGQEISPDKAVIILIDDESGSESRIYRGNSKAEKGEVSGDEDAKIELLANYIEGEIAKRPEVIGILIKSGRRVRYKYVKLVSKAAAKAGGGRPIYVGVESE